MPPERFEHGTLPYEVRHCYRAIVIIIIIIIIGMTIF